MYRTPPPKCPTPEARSRSRPNERVPSIGPSTSKKASTLSPPIIETNSAPQPKDRLQTPLGNTSNFVQSRKKRNYRRNKGKDNERRNGNVSEGSTEPRRKTLDDQHLALLVERIDENQRRMEENYRQQTNSMMEIIRGLQDQVANTHLSTDKPPSRRQPRRRHNRHPPPESEEEERISSHEASERAYTGPPSCGSGYINRRGREIRRVPDLSDKLDDGSSPTYDAWEIILQGRLTRYSQDLPNDSDKMIYVFSQVKGAAQSHLTQRMKSDHPQRFQNVPEMLSWLAGFFRDPNERETARIAYNKCRMSPNETFNHFYSRFSELASKARIDPEDTLSDLFHKLSPALHHTSITFMGTRPDINSALQQFQFFDNELRLNQAATARSRKIENTDSTRSGYHSMSQEPTVSIKREYSVDRAPLRSTPRHGGSQGDGRDRQNLKCYKCGTLGHTSPQCTQGRQDSSHSLAQISGCVKEKGTEDHVGSSDTDLVESENDEP